MLENQDLNGNQRVGLFQLDVPSYFRAIFLFARNEVHLRNNRGCVVAVPHRELISNRSLFCSSLAHNIVAPSISSTMERPMYVHQFR